MNFDTFHPYLPYNWNCKYGWEVYKIFFSVIMESSFGKKTKVLKFEIVKSSINRKSKSIYNMKFWDYVGDCVIAKGIHAVAEKQYSAQEIYIAVPRKQKGGDYYTENIVRSILNRLKYPDFFIL